MRGNNGSEKRLGGINYVTAILLLILIGGGYAAYVFVPVYLSDWKWRREITGQMIKAFDVGDIEIQSELLKHAEMLKIPVAATGSLQITRFKNEIRIFYSYDREVSFPGIKKVHFEKTLKQEIKQVQHLFNKK